MNEFAQAVIVPGHGGNNSVDVIAINKTDPSTHRVDKKFLSQAPGELLRASRELLLYIRGPINGGAIRHFPRTINGQLLVITVAPNSYVVLMFHR